LLKRLIEKQNGRIENQSSSQGDPLLLAARELIGHSLFHSIELDEFNIAETLADEFPLC
jgi:hypothetical protein